MRTSDFDFDYPESQVATFPQRPSRVMMVTDGQPQELDWQSFLKTFSSSDLIVINNTRVVRARIFVEPDIEILFIAPENEQKDKWQVLCPSRKWPKGKSLTLPGGVTAQLLTTGLPQSIQLSQAINDSYFESYGELPIPPYIQKARKQRHSQPEDNQDYQSIFSQHKGSLAAPTASLHFSKEDIEQLKSQGVNFAEVTLHVGLGTFLPIHADHLSEHKMHKEWFEVPIETVLQIQQCKNQGRNIWALGTTVVRALETWGQLVPELDKPLFSDSELFISPGYEFKVVQNLLTNFHQPRSTLVALVSAFSTRESVLHCYRWAIEKGFRLFSYGDLTVWISQKNVAIKVESEEKR